MKKVTGTRGACVPFVLLLLLSVWKPAYSQSSYFELLEDPQHSNDPANYRLLANSLDYPAIEDPVIGYNSDIVIRGRLQGISGNIDVSEVMKDISWTIETPKGDIFEDSVTPGRMVFIHPWQHPQLDVANVSKQLDGAKLRVKITTSQGKSQHYVFTLKRFRLLVLIADANNPDGLLSLDAFYQGLLTNTTGTQVKLSWYWASNVDGKASAVFHIPILRYEGRNWLYRNVELAAALPVTVSSSTSLIGKGLSVGLFRTSKDRTWLQVGAGILNKDNSFFSFIGFDFPALVEWIRDQAAK